MAYADLGIKVKQKYPGTYDDLSDDEVGQKVSEKYPGTYDDIVGTPSSSPTPQVNQAQKPGGFAGFAANTGIGKTFNNTLSGMNATTDAENASKLSTGLNELNTILRQRLDKTTDPVKRQQIEQAMARNSTTASGELKTVAENPQYNKTAKQGIGDLAQAVSEVSLVAKAPATIGGRILQSGATSALASGGSAAGQNKSGMDILGATVAGGLTGAVAVPILEGGTKVVKTALDKTAKGIYNSLIKTPTKQVVSGKSKIGEGLLKRGYVGKPEKMATDLGKATKDNIAKQAEVLNNHADDLVYMQPVVDDLEALRKKISKTPGASTASIDKVLDDLNGMVTQGRPGSQAAIEKAINSGNLQEARNIANALPKSDSYRSSMTSLLDGLGAPPSNGLPTIPVDDLTSTGLTMPASAAHELKQNLQRAVKDSGFMGTLGEAEMRNAQKQAAQTLRNQIEKAIPDIAPINQELEFSRRAAVELFKKAEANPGLWDKIRKTGELGTLVYAFLASNPTFAASVAGERLLSHPNVSTRLARLLYKLGNTSASTDITGLIEKALGMEIGKEIGN